MRRWMSKSVVQLPPTARRKLLSVSSRPLASDRPLRNSRAERGKLISKRRRGKQRVDGTEVKTLPANTTFQFGHEGGWGR